MPAGGLTRRERQERLQDVLRQDPFLTDGELAERFGVSVQTVRLDRLALGIPEVRRRVQAVAQRSLQRIRTLRSAEIVGQVLDLELGRSGLSLLEPTPEMVFERTGLVRGQHLFGQAETLALAIAEADRASVELVNVKFKRPVRVGERLVAKAWALRRRRDGGLVVLVETRVGDEPVLRAKFVVTRLDGSGSPLGPGARWSGSAGSPAGLVSGRGSGVAL
jgi:hypothetical protein